MQASPSRHVPFAACVAIEKPEVASTRPCGKRRPKVNPRATRSLEDSMMNDLIKKMKEAKAKADEADYQVCYDFGMEDVR